MSSADRKAGFGMIKFVVAICLAALLLAGIYFFAVTPKAPSQGQPSPHALDQSR